MSNADFMKATVDFMTAGLFGETVYYKSLSGIPESVATWREMNAVVERAADNRGVSAEIGRSPILVVISKSDLSSVSEQVDKIQYGGNVYSVAQIVSEDAGAFELYCVP